MPYTLPQQFYPQFTPKSVCVLWRLCVLEQKRSHHKLQLSSLLHVLPERWRLHKCHCLNGGEQTWWNTGVNGKGKECQVSWINSLAQEVFCTLWQEHSFKKVNQNFSLIVFKHDLYLRGRNTGTYRLHLPQTASCTHKLMQKILPLPGCLNQRKVTVKWAGHLHSVFWPDIPEKIMNTNCDPNGGMVGLNDGLGFIYSAMTFCFSGIAWVVWTTLNFQGAKRVFHFLKQTAPVPIPQPWDLHRDL